MLGIDNVGLDFAELDLIMSGEGIIVITVIIVIIIIIRMFTIITIFKKASS